MNVADANLNLLVSLDVLLRERSVTRAARVMGISQSSMSNALAQLRVMFDDPLFVRSSHGIVPTPRALALEHPVREGLLKLDQALRARSSFDPDTSSRKLVIATSEYVELVLVPNLRTVLARTAPHVKLVVRSHEGAMVPPELGRGEVDVFIGRKDEVPPGHHRQPLFEESYVCVVRRGHPAARRELTLRRYLELEHVVVRGRVPERSTVDRALLRLGKTRRIGAEASHFLLIPSIVASTDMVAVLSKRVADTFARAYELRIVPPPFKLPKARLGQIWHESSANDPGAIWLRRLIASLARRV